MGMECICIFRRQFIIINVVPVTIFIILCFQSVDPVCIAVDILCIKDIILYSPNKGNKCHVIVINGSCSIFDIQIDIYIWKYVIIVSNNIRSLYHQTICMIPRKLSNIISFFILSSDSMEIHIFI